MVTVSEMHSVARKRRTEDGAAEEELCTGESVETNVVDIHSELHSKQLGRDDSAATTAAYDYEMLAKWLK
jgi:hypothetical protein